MSQIRIGINGLGRIGRFFLRQSFNHQNNLEVKALNSSGSSRVAGHLIKYDSVHGIFDKKVQALDENHLQIDSHIFQYSNTKDIQKIPWENVDVILECTGVFKTKQDLKYHFKNQVQKVVVAAPAEGADQTLVYGVNHHEYDKKKHHIVSNASCTTNCVAPLIDVMRDFGIQNGYITTTHSYTSDQKLLDGNHRDLRRARAAGLSIIPTTTGVVKAISKIFPSLKGKFQGLAFRVPVANVSLVELTLMLEKQVSLQEVQEAFKLYAQKNPNVLFIEDEPLVSVDFNGSSYSAILDWSLTQVHGKTLQLFAWYDNEAGYTHRLFDIMKILI